jgi:hypothetical protein
MNTPITGTMFRLLINFTIFKLIINFDQRNTSVIIHKGDHYVGGGGGCSKQKWKKITHTGNEIYESLEITKLPSPEKYVYSSV